MLLACAVAVDILYAEISTKRKITVSDASISERDIEDAFSKFGSISECWVATYAPFFAFVVFKSRDDAEDAVKYINGT